MPELLQPGRSLHPGHELVNFHMTQGVRQTTGGNRVGLHTLPYPPHPLCVSFVPVFTSPKTACSSAVAFAFIHETRVFSLPSAAPTLAFVGDCTGMFHDRFRDPAAPTESDRRIEDAVTAFRQSDALAQVWNAYLIMMLYSCVCCSAFFK